jgi:hypothetical protein
MNFDQVEYQHVSGADATETQRNAYNAAFRALGFHWQWDADTYRDLMRIPEEMERIGTYLVRHQTNLLSAYAQEFLSGLIIATKQRCEDCASEVTAAPAPFDDVQ